MKEKYTDSTLQRPEGERIIDGTQVSIDLPAFIKKIREESTWKESDRNAITVFKNDSLRIVLIALHKAAEMVKHIAKGTICVQVLEGHVQFKTGMQTVELSKGQMLVLHEAIPHSVLAIKESVFLLTLTVKSEEPDIY